MKEFKLLLGRVLLIVVKHMADQSGATLAEETTENQSYKSQAEKRAYEHKQQFQSQRKKVNGIKC